MWSFLKHYDGAQQGKRKTASATLLNRNGFGEGNDTNQGRRVFFILLIFWGLFTQKDHLTHHNIFKMAN
jgi:hypothetical protein